MSVGQASERQFVALSREHYAYEVRRVLKEVMADGDCSLKEAIFQCLGAFPTVPLALALGNLPGSTAIASSLPYLSAPWRIAEGDLLLSEWYFTPKCTARLVDMFAAGDQRIFAIGCPTIAVEAAKLASARVLLIDASPWVSIEPGSIEHRREDVVSLAAEKLGEGTYFIDPPWHLDDYQDWLHALSLSLAPGSRVCMVLPQQLSSRASRAIRSFSFDFFASRGKFDVIHDAVDYDTPEFEATMLRTAGLSARNWRRGDVLDVRIEATVPEAAPSVGSFLSSQWVAFNFGGRVIRLKTKTPGRSTNFRFIAGQESGSWILPDPSRSRLRDNQINCLTSAGIALKVTDGLDLLADALTALQAGWSLSKAIQSLSVGAEDRRQLRKACTLLLELQEGKAGV
jgi:hypothetical protein